MLEFSRSAEVAAENEDALRESIWTIEASQGRFRPILARCNYMALQAQMVGELKERCPIPIREIVLEGSQTRLDATIRERCGDDRASAVMVLGLESISKLDSLLAAMNQMREELSQHCPFPLVLWVNDEVVGKLVRLAPAFADWCALTEFAIAPEDLLEALVRRADALFSGILERGDRAFALAESVSGDRAELEAAVRDLHQSGQILTPDLAAQIEFMRARDAYESDRINEALAWYRQSLEFWQQSQNGERQGAILFDMGACHYRQAELHPTESRHHLEAARSNFEQCLEVLERDGRSDLVAKFIGQLGEVLRRLEDWQSLSQLAEKSHQLHETPEEMQVPGNAYRLARDCGFLAEVALHQDDGMRSKALATRALEISNTLPEEERQDRAWYLLLLGRSQRKLGEIDAAVGSLERARESDPTANPQLYIKILKELQSLYYGEKREYLKAFQVRQYRRLVERQFGFRAFIGAGYLQPQKKSKLALIQKEEREAIAPEIMASGRQKDVEKLIERIGSPQHKLTVIHGLSGVGKSSLVNAGLIPSLQGRSIGTRDVLPVHLRVYTDWERELGQQLSEALSAREISVPTPLISMEAIVEQLQRNEQNNLLTVFIFDQFEEFFFVYPKSGDRQRFSDFLGQCLNIPFFTLVLSIRADYIHYLLPANQLPSMAIINNDILSKNILYAVDNFSPEEAKDIIQTLTRSSQFQLEPVLVDEMVRELAKESGEVRPIELQIIGAQMQADRIVTLEKYRQKGGKEKLIARYLDDVIQTCGPENEKLSRLVLYLLTDENNTRPLKTRSDIEKDPLTEELLADSTQLDLVLRIAVGSGLVVLVPESPTDRYQLVHDYLVPFIRKQRNLYAELKKEQEQRQRTEAQLTRVLKRLLKVSVAAGLSVTILAASAIIFWLEAKFQKFHKIHAISASSETLFAFDQELEALIEAIRAGLQLQKLGQTTQEKQIPVLRALGTAVYGIREYNRLEGHDNVIVGVTFSPDGKTIASASHDRTVKLWTLDGTLINTLNGHIDYVRAVRFSPDGEILASVSYDKTIKLWKRDGTLLNTLEGHTERVNEVSFSPDGEILASVSDDNTVKLWKRDGTLLNTLEGHTERITGVSFSPEGKTIASASKDSTVKLWGRDGTLLNTLEDHTEWVNEVCFSPDGQIIASASDDNTVKLWQRDGTLIDTLEGHTDGVWGIACSSDSQMIASAGEDRTVKLWKRDGTLVKTFIGHNASVYTLAFSPNGQRIAAGDGSHIVKLWNLDGILTNTLTGHRDEVDAVKFSPDGETIASAGEDKTVKLWQRDGTLLNTLEGHDNGVMDVSFSPDEQTIASASKDGTVKLWQRDGTFIRSIEGHDDDVVGVSFSPDSQTIASASWDGTVKLWKPDGIQLETLIGHTDWVSSVHFSPDGETIASSSRDGTVKLWKPDGTLINTLTGHRGWIPKVKFSPDGQIIASASIDKTIRLWRRDGTPLMTLKGHRNWVDGVSFSPDGQMLASASDDNTVKLWEIDGTLLMTLEGHDDWVYKVDFSPDGKTIASASADKTVILWELELDIDKLLMHGCNHIRAYLKTNPNVDESDRTLCDGIGTPE